MPGFSKDLREVGVAFLGKPRQVGCLTLLVSAESLKSDFLNRKPYYTG